MTTRRYEYHNKDIPMIKKDIVFRFIFLALFAFAFAWQFAFILRDFSLNTLTQTKTLVGIIALLMCLLFVLVALTYAYRGINIINSIKHHGKSVKNVTVVSDTKKGSFVKMYSHLTRFITLIMALALVSGLTYGILEYIYYSTISFYLPIMLLVTTAGLNSVYHITTEIKIMKEVQEYNSIY